MTADLLISARRQDSEHEIPVYDDDDQGRIFVWRHSLGIGGIVRARSWEDAYSIAEDEFMPEADETIDQLIKEYGFRRQHVKIVQDSSVQRPDMQPGCGIGERYERPEDYSDNGRLPQAGNGSFIRWYTIETPDPDAWVENELFCEAYGFRNNGPRQGDTHGHGIYAKDLSGDSLDNWESLPELELRLTFKCRDCDQESIGQLLNGKLHFPVNACTCDQDQDDADQDTYTTDTTDHQHTPEGDTTK